MVPVTLNLPNADLKESGVVAHVTSFINTQTPVDFTLEYGKKVDCGPSAAIGGMPSDVIIQKNMHIITIKLEEAVEYLTVDSPASVTTFSGQTSSLPVSVQKADDTTYNVIYTGDPTLRFPPSSMMLRFSLEAAIWASAPERFR